MATTDRGAAPIATRGEMTIFWASFMTLIAAGIGFSVRGAILDDWGKQFGFSQSELGTITGGGLIGFGVTIIVLSFFADLIGYGKLMLLAFTLHLLSAVVTFAATPIYDAGGIFGYNARDSAYGCLFIGMWLFALGNGTCEAVINPLTASLFPHRKTHYLNILHAGWPLGLIIGAAAVYGFEQVPALGALRWEYKLGIFLIPVLLYGILMFNKPFPRSEAEKSGVPMGEMVLTLLTPLLLFLFLLQACVGYVELGTDSWITNIGTTILANKDKALLAFIWTNLLMFVLRFFAGPIVERINPIGLLFVSAVLGTVGLFLMSRTDVNSMGLWLAVVTIYALGKTFYWPTMLGVISERFPKGGALALGFAGGIGMLSAGLLGGPGIGYKQDLFALRDLQQNAPEALPRYQVQLDPDPKKDNRSNFPLFGKLAGTEPILGIDNAKFGVLTDGAGQPGDPGSQAEGKSRKLYTDIQNLEAKNVPVPKELDELKGWWEASGKPNASQDQPKLVQARLFGARQALLYTAAVPAFLALSYLLLLGYFKLKGGYKQVHIDH